MTPIAVTTPGSVHGLTGGRASGNYLVQTRTFCTVTTCVRPGENHEVDLRLKEGNLPFGRRGP